jgi:hypothetical protein
VQQNWKKLGQVFNPLIHLPDGYCYGAVPIVRKIKNNILFVFFTARNSQNKSVLCEVEICLDRLIPISKTKVDLLVPGSIGSFDEDGVMASDIFTNDGIDYITYIGWNRGITVPFRNAIGIAEYTSLGIKKIYDGPILDRSIYDPCFVASNCVVKIGFSFVMYYLSCSKWDVIDNKLTHYYNIKIAESKDGITWRPTGKIAINFKHKDEYAISVPRVIKDNKIYKMWYSFRGSSDATTYRIGYAESFDGFLWERKDNIINLIPSELGWDSEMVCYPYIFEQKNSKFILYNGNGYGKTGFGIAKLEK